MKKIALFVMFVFFIAPAQQIFSMDESTGEFVEIEGFDLDIKTEDIIQKINQIDKKIWTSIFNIQQRLEALGDKCLEVRGNLQESVQLLERYQRACHDEYELVKKFNELRNVCSQELIDKPPVEQQDFCEVLRVAREKIKNAAQKSTYFFRAKLMIENLAMCRNSFESTSQPDWFKSSPEEINDTMRVDIEKSSYLFNHTAKKTPFFLDSLTATLKQHDEYARSLAQALDSLGECI